MFVPEMEFFWSKPPIPPRFGHFVSIGHILSHLVKFCLFQSYFAHIMCYFWYLFSWSIILFSWSDIHQIAKISQNVVIPPQRVASRIIPAKCVPFID